MTIADIRSKTVELLALIDALETPPPSGLGTPAYSVGPVLLERATTNLAFPSHMGSWSTTNANLTAEAGGVRITETTGNGFHECYKSVGIGSGPHCHSVEVKAGTATKGRIWFVKTNVGFYADFDLAAGTISAASNFGGSTPHKSFIIPLEDGWFRVAVSGTVNVASGFIDIALRENGIEYAGTGKYLLARNAQSEAGIAPSSFVATTSTAATRPQSSIVGTIPAVQAITLAIHARTPVAWPSDYAVLCHYDNNIPLNPYNDLEPFQDSFGNFIIRVTHNNTNYSDINFGVIEPNTEFKLALTASAAGLKASFNGGAVQSVSIPTWPTDLTFRRWGTQMQGIREWNGWLYKAEQWNAVATDSQLQALSV